MARAEDLRNRQRLSNAFLAGEKIFGIKFRHNSLVAFRNDAGERFEGWIVAVGPVDPEPLYTVERCDGGGDEEVVESRIELITDPHEPKN